MHGLPGFPSDGDNSRSKSISDREFRDALAILARVMKALASMLLLVSMSTATAAPPKEPAPVIEPTGPLRLARYTKPFAPAQPNTASRDFAARNTYGTPLYFYY